MFYGEYFPRAHCYVTHFHLLVPLVNPRRPSEFWLNNPAWIGMFLICKVDTYLITPVSADGALDPPHFYHTRADIAAALRAAGRHVPQPLLSTAPLGGIQPASPASDVTTEPASPVASPILNTAPVSFAPAVIRLTPETAANAPVKIQGMLHRARSVAPVLKPAPAKSNIPISKTADLPNFDFGPDSQWGSLFGCSPVSKRHLSRCAVLVLVASWPSPFRSFSRL
jgi:hypothetical protein